MTLLNFCNAKGKSQTCSSRLPVVFEITRTSIAGMFKTYNTSSTGIDGLVPFYYHSFSYFIFGSISGLLGINTLTFANICVPILIIPIFFLAFLFCVKEVGEYYSEKLNIQRIDEKNIRFWIFFSIFFTLPLPYQILGHVGMGRERYFYLISHSYLFALLLTFILFSIIFSYLNLNKKEGIVSTYNRFFFVGTIVLFYLSITLSKISFLYVLGSIYGYVFLRLKFYKNIYHMLFLIHQAKRLFLIQHLNAIYAYQAIT